MGANVSTSNIDIVNKSIISVMLNSAQNCSQYTENTQTIASGGIGLFGSYKQSAKISLSCLQNLQIDNNLLTQMAEQILTDTKQNNTPLLPSVNVGDVKTNIKNILTTKINQSFIQSCNINLKNIQTQVYGGLQIGTASKQDVDVLVSCISNALNNNGVAQSITTNTSQSNNMLSKSPLGFITDIITNFTWMIYIVVFLIVGGILYLFLGKID